LLHSFKLLLPALIPSWRFFDRIAPSPRIEFILLKSARDTSEDWQEFRPRPARISITSMAKRMVWNPGWNEQLFLVSCAERLAENPAAPSMVQWEQEIWRRIAAALPLNPEAPFLQFRLVFVSRAERHIAFISEARER
jgi:hypothetical protein